jgi:hypothetical protein
MKHSEDHPASKRQGMGRNGIAPGLVKEAAQKKYGNIPE